MLSLKIVNFSEMLAASWNDALAFLALFSIDFLRIISTTMAVENTAQRPSIHDISVHVPSSDETMFSPFPSFYVRNLNKQKWANQDVRVKGLTKGFQAIPDFKTSVEVPAGCELLKQQMKIEPTENKSGMSAVIALEAEGSNNGAITWNATVTPIQNWYSVAMSSSGQYQAVVAFDGAIWSSNYYGLKWAQSSAPMQSWTSIAISSSGQYQTAISYNGGGIWCSRNFGSNWMQTSTQSDNWVAVSLSATGQYQTVLVFNGGGIWISNNYGTTWVMSSAPVGNWISVAVSPSGQKQTAVVNGGSIWVSINYGVDWTRTSGPTQNWVSVSISTAVLATGGTDGGTGDDNTGQYLTAAVYGGGIWISNNSGTQWRQTSVPRGHWNSVAMSANGDIQTAVLSGGGMWGSTDFGESWIQTSALLGDWQCVAMSSDGSYRTAVVYGGDVYVSNTVAGPTLSPTVMPSMEPSGSPLPPPTAASSTRPTVAPTATSTLQVPASLFG